MTVIAIEIREFGTDDLVKRIDLTRSDDRHVERVMRGLLMQMNTDRFYAVEVES